jgi:carboxyl-terminal processing protease
MVKKLLLSFICFCTYEIIYSQSSVNLQTDALKLIGMIEKFHVNPPVMDSSFSVQVFDAFISKLDPAKQLFTPEDLVQLNSFRFSILLGLKEKSWKFPELVKTIYTRRLKQYDSLLNIILSSPLDLNKQESIYWKESFDPAHNLNPGEYYRKWLKYQVLSQMFANNDSVLIQGTESTVEAKAQKTVLKSESHKISKLLAEPTSIDDFISSSFLNAIALSADPHSEYMSTHEKYTFESKLQSEALSFGLQTNMNDNYELKIVGLTPGGPAWKSNALHKDDIIVSFKLSGKEKTNINDLDLDEISEILTSPQNTKIEFFIRKPDGTLKSVVLVKAKIEQDENMVKSYILKGTTKIGYISLPDFYTQFENTAALGCANDVAKECIKLRKDNIGGLIIDLRDNGGGSVKEAIDISGLFIDYGPICMIKEKGQKPAVIKDFNRGTAFNGPLVILMNKESASASEIFAAAMQDYKRAIIIGSNSYGKATAQVILPCDTNAKNENDAQAFVKLTVEKIYRITGKSNQQTGISTDIHLPDILDAFVTRESDEKNSLQNDSIKKAFFTSLPDLGIAEINEKSSNRIANNNAFKTIRHLSDSIQAHKALGTLIPLDMVGFSKYYFQKKEFMNKLEQALENKNAIYSVETTKFDNVLKSINSDFNSQNTEMIKNDPYIQESYNIISDMVTIKQTQKP